MKGEKVVLFFSLVALFSINCVRKEATVPLAVEKPLPGVDILTKEIRTWETEWERILRESSKEGKVVVVSGMDPDTRAAITKAVKGKFNLEVEWLAARGVETTEKVSKERKAGIYSYDVFMGGYDTALAILKPMGAIVPMRPLLILPEVLDANAWVNKELFFIDKDRMIFRFLSYPSVNIGINTDLVKKGEIKSHLDTLNPKWKGKMMMDDPTINGAGMRWAVLIGEYTPQLGWEFQRKLAMQEPVLSRDRRLMAEWLARGKYAIMAEGSTTEIKRMKEAGAPVEAFVAKETYTSSSHGNLAYFDKAPHPRAAQVFINWLLSREGQMVAASARMQQSARTDISIDYLPEEETREYVLKLGGTLIDPKDEELIEVQEKSIPKIMEIWKPLAGR